MFREGILQNQDDEGDDERSRARVDALARERRKEIHNALITRLTL